MPQTTDEERKKGAVLAALGAAGAAGAGGAPSFTAFMLASGGGRAAAAALAAGLACGGYGAALTYKTLHAPPPRVFEPKLSAPADPDLRRITPQTSLEVVGIVADGASGPAAAPTGDQAALAAAAAQGEVPAVASGADPAALAEGAGAAVRAAAAAGRAGPNHIVPRRSAFGAAGRGVMAGSPQPGADVAPFAAVRRAATTAAPAEAALAASGAGAAAAGQARALDREAPRRLAADIGRTSAAGGRAGAMRQLGGANALSRGGGGAEASATRGAQAFDGGAAAAPAAPGALGPTEAAKEAAAATAEDYGEGGAPMSAQPQAGGGAAAPAPEPGHDNATPWQSWVDIATYLMLGAVAMLTTAVILGFLAWQALCSPEPTGRTRAVLLFKIAKALCLAAGVMGLGAVALGGQVMSMGQTKQGMIMLIGGGLITAVSAFAWMAGAGAEHGVELVLAAGAA